jgi:hypothetical protein
MRLRLAVALLALIGVTAFAPAPLPRRPKEETPVSLQALNGDWTLIDWWRYASDGEVDHAVRRCGGRQVVRIKEGTWTFCLAKGDVLLAGESHELAINTRRRPTGIDFLQPGTREVEMSGSIRFNGDTVEVLYDFDVNRRPTDFARPPRGAFYLRLTRRP